MRTVVEPDAEEISTRLITLEALRRAAAALVEPETANLEGAFPRVPKRAFAALFEQAFPDAPHRGLAYPEEVEDLGRWLVECATLDGDHDRCDLLLASVGAWHADCVDAADKNDPRRELVRAIAIYFLRRFADTAAALLRDQEGKTTTVDGEALR